jgi:hypothetical protein
VITSGGPVNLHRSSVRELPRRPEVFVNAGSRGGSLALPAFPGPAQEKPFSYVNLATILG